MSMARRSPTATAAALILVTGLVACGGSDPQTPDELDVAGITEQTSDFQREILADGMVTYAEYEHSTLAAIECIKNEGIVVEGPEPRDGDSRFLRYYMVVEGVHHERASVMIDAASEKCETDFSSDVSRVWEYQNLLSPAQREEMRAHVIDCLQAAGVDVSEDATDDEVFSTFVSVDEAHEEAVSECRLQYQDYFVVGVK